MRRGRRPRDPYRSAIAALERDFARHQEDAAKVRALIDQLSTRIEAGSGTVPVPHVPPPKVKRRRRRRRARRARAANTKLVQARRKPRDKRAVVDATPDVPKPATDTKPVAAPDPTVAAAAAAAAKARRAAHMREYRARRRQEAAGEEASAPKPKKRAKAPRKPAVPIPAPVVQRTAWHPDENGNLTREVITS